eukprot:4646104-Alexandrium_andersonii.AAC.1
MTRAAHPPHETRPRPPVRMCRFLPPFLAGRGGGCGRAAKVHRKTPLHPGLSPQSLSRVHANLLDDAPVE